MTTYDVDKAFDELTDVVIAQVRTMPNKTKCACCEEQTDRFLKLYLCDKHLTKYEEIITHE